MWARKHVDEPQMIRKLRFRHPQPDDFAGPPMTKNLDRVKSGDGLGNAPRCVQPDRPGCVPHLRHSSEAGPPVVPDLDEEPVAVTRKLRSWRPWRLTLNDEFHTTLRRDAREQQTEKLTIVDYSSAHRCAPDLPHDASRSGLSIGHLKQSQTAGGQVETSRGRVDVLRHRSSSRMYRNTTTQIANTAVTKPSKPDMEISPFRVTVYMRGLGARHRGRPRVGTDAGTN